MILTRSHHPSRSSRGGFTLIEVLAAIGILVIVLPALMQAYSIVGEVAAAARQRSEAIAVAQSALEEQLATGDWQLQNATGEEKPGPTLYQWETSVQTWDDIGTQQLTVTVTWQRGQQEYSLVLDTLVFNPANAPVNSTGGGIGGGILGGSP